MYPFRIMKRKYLFIKRGNKISSTLNNSHSTKVSKFTTFCQNMPGV